ncbi:MAG: hypothetical protein A4E67_01635 [Syntrophaceae bacterium PtaB.Bin038]|nr:MAG: hypothetical protein A4E67_01635 [Syntrophaceae bacterium PtaB.Bin038]
MPSHDEVGVRVGDEIDPFRAALGGLFRHAAHRRGMGRDGPEIPLDQLQRLVRVDVPHDGDHRVARRVVPLEEGLEGVGGQEGDVRRPADDRTAVGARREGRGEEELRELPRGDGLVGLPALLHHDVPLRVELPHHGVHHPVGLDAGPELDAVRGQAHLVRRHVLPRRGVEAHGPVFRVETVDLVFDDPLLGFALQLLELPLEALDLRLVGAGPFHPLAVERRARFPDPLQHPLLLREVLRPDRAGALEQHVLQEVGRPGLAFGLVDGPHEVADVQGDGGARVPLHEEHPQAVVERDPLNAVLQVVGRGCGGRQGDEDRRRNDERGVPRGARSGSSHDGRGVSFHSLRNRNAA